MPMTTPLSASVAARLVVALAAGLLALEGGDAAAAPPSAEAVIGATTRAQPAPGWVQATYLQIRDEGPPRLALRISLSPDGAIRQDVERLDGLGGLDTRVWRPADEAAPPEHAPGWLQVLAGRPLAGILAGKGVRQDLVSFARDGATILWVLGAGPHEPELPQIHVERATGRLRAFVEEVTESDTSRAVTVRLDGALGPAGSAGAPWPERITITPAEGAEVAFSIRSFSLGEPLSASLFAPPERGEPRRPAGLRDP